MAREDVSRPGPVHEFVFNGRVQAQSEFDELHRDHVESVVADIGRTYDLLIMGVLKGTPGLGPRYDGLSLLNEGLSLLVSSLNLSRQRARLDAMALLRVAVEAACVAAHIALDSDAYARYTRQITKKYDSGRAIPFAKPHIHRVGEFWGALSQAVIHPNRIGFGPRLANDGTESIRIGTPSANPTQDLLSLAVVSVASLIVFRTAELTLFEPDPSEPDMLRLVGGNLGTWPIANKLLQDRFRRLDALTARLNTAADRT